MPQNKLETMAPTKFLHAVLVCFIQEEIALFHSTMYLKTQAQTGIFHQLRVDVMDQGLLQETCQDNLKSNTHWMPDKNIWKT